MLILVTLLSILGTHSIALPLSPAFPAHELQYIMDQSQASMLLSSNKFERKAHEILEEGLATKPKHIQLQKLLGGTTPKPCSLRGLSDGHGGMMLYTSGTTNRPVCTSKVEENVLSLNASRKEYSFPRPL
jgi:malonyl-CoA/methylmalonyl-CoA synthetase